MKIINEYIKDIGTGDFVFGGDKVGYSTKEIKEGIVVGFTTFEGKVGVAIGITSELTKKYDAETLVKSASEVLGGKGGGGRKDFAQAGGINKDKIEEAFKILSKKIN